jgi:2-aminoadipate transaminase
MREGRYHQHVETLRAGYREKRDAMLASLERYLPQSGCCWTRPGGGLYIWLALPAGIDTSRTAPLFQAALEAGVLYVPGEYCYHPDASGKRPTNHMRLSFGQVAPDQIDLGIRRLASVIGAAIAKFPPQPDQSDPQ